MNWWAKKPKSSNLLMVIYLLIAMGWSHPFLADLSQNGFPSLKSSSEKWLQDFTVACSGAALWSFSPLCHWQVPGTDKRGESWVAKQVVVISPKMLPFAILQIMRKSPSEEGWHCWRSEGTNGACFLCLLHYYLLNFALYITTYWFLNSTLLPTDLCTTYYCPTDLCIASYWPLHCELLCTDLCTPQ